MNEPGVFEENPDRGDVQSDPRRKRGEDRIWRIGRMYWIQYYVHGQQVRESSHSDNKRAAERLLAKRFAEIEADTFLGPAARRLRYEQIRDALYGDYQINRRRWLRIGKNGETYICGVVHLDDFFANHRALAITTRLVREFIAKRQEDGASNGTINRELALLRRMFKLAVEDGTLNSIPHFPMLKEASPRRGFLEWAIFKNFDANSPNTCARWLRPATTPGCATARS